MLMYNKVSEAIFLARHKRFTATVRQGDELLTVHVKNTGRCAELLIPGAKVILAQAASATRKTAHNLVAVYKGDMLVNIDSQAPNRAAISWLKARYPHATIRPEARFQDSRLDFHLSGQGLSLYVEVKGCTLEQAGLAMFPDAPTLRGSRHLRTLAACVVEGHQALALFVIQMRPVHAFSPHDAMDPAFGRALREAMATGVTVQAVDCLVTPDSMAIHQAVPLLLA